jgi:hypothetical protein
MLAGFLGEKHVLDPNDVQAIAREIRDEMGPDATLGPALHVATHIERPVLEPMVDPAPWKKGLREIEERMDRLEKLVNTAVNLLHRTLLEEQRTTQPGTPVKR